MPLVVLMGEDTTPFGGILIEGVTEADALAYRDLHMKLRSAYTNNEDARALAARPVSYTHLTLPTILRV